MNVKLWFKSKSYWLRGGITSLGIVTIMFLIPFIFDKLVGNLTVKHYLYEIIYIPLLFISLPLIMLLSYLGFFTDSIFHTGAGYMSLQSYPIGQVITFIIAIAYYFLIGALIGLVIGKMKSKK